MPGILKSLFGYCSCIQKGSYSLLTQNIMTRSGEYCPPDKNTQDFRWHLLFVQHYSTDAFHFHLQRMGNSITIGSAGL